MSAESGHVLLVTYEFPPSAGPGVQRVAAFAKYLMRAGWRVSVVCAEPIAGRPLDPSMAEEVARAAVVRIPARHVASAIARALAPLKRSRAGAAASAAGTAGDGGAEAPASAPLSTRISRWIAVPDDAVRWRPDAVEAAVRLAASDPVDAVLASGPPYSALLAGADIGQRLGVPCVLDLRDPWRDNAGLRWPTAWHRSRSEALERDALALASAVTAVSAPIAEEALSMGARSATVIPNGYDPERMPAWAPDASAPFTIAFLGRFGTSVTNPRPFFAGLAEARKRSEAAARARLVVVGPEFAWVDEAAAAYGVADQVRSLGYLPHASALAEVARADAGLIVLADVPGSRAIYSSKLFEYLGVGVPVLLVGPQECAAADVVRESGAGVVASVGDTDEIARAIVAMAQAKEAGAAARAANTEVVRRFDRKAQVEQLSQLLVGTIGAAR